MLPTRRTLQNRHSQLSEESAVRDNVSLFFFFFVFSFSSPFTVQSRVAPPPLPSHPAVYFGFLAIFFSCTPRGATSTSMLIFYATSSEYRDLLTDVCSTDRSARVKRPVLYRATIARDGHENLVDDYLILPKGMKLLVLRLSSDMSMMRQIDVYTIML